jgi:hypothetical protein
MTNGDNLETTVVWCYNMDAAPKDRTLQLSVKTRFGLRELDGQHDDDRHAKCPRPYWRYWSQDITWSRENPPHAWRLPSPAPVREVAP